MTKRYLLATDLSETSSASEDYARSFLNPDRASVHLLTVIDLFDERKILEFSSDLNPEHLQERHEEQALKNLKPLAEKFRNAGFTTEYEALHGRPGPKICDRAEGLDVEGIFIGRGRHSRLGEFFQGSVSRYVVLNAPVSVIVTPS